jgi:integrase/recombinase XerD
MPSPNVSAWPIQDQAMWASLFEAGSPLDEQGALSHLRPTGANALKHAYRQWIHWLQSTDPAALDSKPEDRVTMTRLRQWCEGTAELRPMSRLFYVNGTLEVLFAFAPNADWSAQKSLLKQLKRLAGHGDKSRKAGRVLASSVLFNAGIRHAEAHAKAEPTRLEAAMQFQMGTIVAMLAVMPLRCTTFRRLELGTSVHVDGSSVEITVPGDMMKTGHPWDATVPDAVLPQLLRYLQEFRPWLMQRLGKRHNFLWVTRKGDPFNSGYFGVRVALATTEATGVRVSPHLFRDAAATTLARMSPQSARLIKPVLAHSCTDTAEDHYIHAGSIEAGRNHAALIQNLRKRA